MVSPTDGTPSKSHGTNGSVDVQAIVSTATNGSDQRRAIVSPFIRTRTPATFVIGRLAS
jgi:hypothetical protein